MTKTLKPFQIEAIEQINRFTTKVLSDKDLNNPIVVLKSPTGSGKTLMLTKIIENIVESNRLSLAFIWISIGSGDLHIQSARAVSKYISKKFKINELSSNSNLSRTHLLENEILFLNWEKIYTKKNDQFANVIMRDSENINLPFFLEETRKKNRKIVLIIDEAHRNTTTERAKELKDLYIKPDAIIEASATPILEHTYKHEVSIKDVIDQGLIKKAIYINDSIDDIENMDELDSFHLVVNKAIEKRKNIQLELLKLNIKDLNPLILFQIPDSKDGDLILSKLRNYLDSEHNITETNGKLGVWLDKEHRDFSKDSIVKNDSPIECLVFKKAISTGWDCPRAWILVKFRQIKTETFMVQTVGRILRMPYARHFDNEILDNGYVYTNLEKIQVNQDPYSPNIIKNRTSKCRSKINRNLNIKSYYKSRGGDYNDIDATYNEFLVNFAFKQYKDKGINQFLSFKLNDITHNLFKDELLDLEKLDLDVNRTANNFSVKLSYEDLLQLLDHFIKKHIININISRSISVIRYALFNLIRKLYPQLFTKNEWATIIFNNKEYFEKLLDNSIRQFRA
ncbi:MAG: hypothetical protein E7Y34_01185, partial [Mycoplasma sp.]|nr:hypothetical protein [Mycoplasma sp.]